MKPNLVVLRLPVRDLHTGVKEVFEPSAQALLTQPAMEALHMAVLHRPAGLDMAQFDLPLQPPGQEVATGQFGSVVATDRLWDAASCDHFVQHACHTTAGEAGVNLQRKTLAGEGIHDAQHPDRASCRYHIVCEVQGPLLVGSREPHLRRTAAPFRDIPGTVACGSLARPPVPAVPEACGSHSAASPATAG